MEFLLMLYFAIQRIDAWSNMQQSALETISHQLKALSDETRLRMFTAMEDREWCVCQLIELTGLAPSTVSKHLSVLHQAGLVERRKTGRWKYYKRSGMEDFPIIGKICALVFQSLENDANVQAAKNRLAEIGGMNMEELCRKIAKK